tara:strand:- start:123 stop:662 length:540 start_codon:yes stop_codon:yes gene_type:complete
LSKFEIAISTLFIGFIVGQTTDFIKYKWQLRRQKKAVRSEIKDIQSDLGEKTERIKQVIAELNSSHIGVQVPGKISTLIFDKYFAEVAPYFSENERKSIITIYNNVKHFNDERDDGNRNSMKLVKRSLFLMYQQGVFGYAASTYLLENGGDKLFLHETDKITQINKDIESFAKSCEIIN